MLMLCSNFVIGVDTVSRVKRVRKLAVAVNSDCD